MLTLYDATRCPYCARVRIALAEKAIPYDVHAIDLSDRPAWLYAKNPTGKVPVIEEDDGLVLPESRVIMEYLDERFPDPPLQPADAAERALAKVLLERFEDFSGPYYDLYFDRPGGSAERVYEELARLEAILAGQPFLSGRAYGLTDIGYVPWIFRCETRLGLDVRGRYPVIAEWLARLEERPAIAAEAAVVVTL
jgi:RNA polymerase-associated protein